jgi:hypothetical protein
MRMRRMIHREQKRTRNRLICHAELRLRLVHRLYAGERVEYCLEVDGVGQEVFEVFAAAT